jgi:hypothetical protein
MKSYQLDNDTKKYVKRLNYNGVKTPSDIYSVDQFIRGLRDIGVYGKLREIWFLRDNQNASSGSIRYPFKDGNNLCALVNNPVQTSNGINAGYDIPSAASSSYLSLDTPAILDNFSFGYIGAGLSNVASTLGFPILMFQNNGNYFYDSVSITYRTTTTNRVYMTNYNYLQNTNFTVGINADLSYGTNSKTFQGINVSWSLEENFGRYRRGNGIISTTLTSPSNYGPRYAVKNKMYAPGRFDGTSVAGLTNINITYSAIFLFAPNIDSDWVNVYSIAKDTIAKGLALP